MLGEGTPDRPAVLLADEPTGNLDTESARQVLELLRAQRDAGQTIVMVTHDARVATAADRLLTMEDGRFIGTERGGPSTPRFDDFAIASQQ